MCDSEYTFPFEGNWNQQCRCIYYNFHNQLWIHFPVWRELKRGSGATESGPTCLWIHFPVWRELKLYVTITSTVPFRRLFTLNPLSRLKGIETLPDLLLYDWQLRLWIHFPVWRELKHKGRLRLLKHRRKLWIHFPVWRELKLVCQFEVNFVYLLWIHFPVWRELKLVCQNWPKKSKLISESTFPFEGNWNKCWQISPRNGMF